MIRVLLCVAALAACGSSRTTYARYPNAPVQFDRAGSDPKAIEIAEKLFAASGGAGNWDLAKQISWHQTVTSDGKVVVDFEETWDRWNARHHGRLHRPDGTSVVVGYELYGNFTMGFAQQGKKQTNLDLEGRARGLKIARDAYNVDTAVLTLQFLLFEPGAKLAYVGVARDDANNENYDELVVTFDDPLRKELEFHAIVDRTSNLLHRIEILKVGTTQKIGYILTNWTTVNGLKFAATRTNLGYSGETIAIKELKVSAPDDDLFIAPITY